MKTNLARTLVASLVVAGALALAPSAGAAITCTFETDLLHIEMDAPGDRAHLEIGGGGTILVNNGPTPVLCGPGGPPTVTNTETVEIVDSSDNPGTPAPTDGSGWVEVVEPSAFVPGATLTNENGGAGEIEFAVNLNAGSDDTFLLLGANPGDDNWVTGAAGINWNAGAADPAPDAEAEIAGAEILGLAGLGGDDLISAQGGPGAGGPYSGASQLVLLGGADDDTLEGSDLPPANGVAGDRLFGDLGNDTLRGLAGNDFLLGDSGDDLIDGGAGEGDNGSFTDSIAGATVDLNQNEPQDTGSGSDSLTGVERLEGSANADILIGDAGANTLIGEDDNDTLDGRGGADTLDGGSEADTITYAEAAGGVTANLTAGTATGGAGSDTLTGVENLIGSPFADTLIGSAEANSLTGLGGADTISALAGPDAVDVRDGVRDAASCGSQIDSAIADAEGVDAIDPDCETVAFAPADGGGGEPSNEFSFGKAKKNKRKGTAKLTVIVPGPGGLELAKSKKVKGDEERAEAEGSVTLTVKSKGKAKRKLTRRGKAKVNAEVTYTPDGGQPNSESKKLKLVKKTKARR